MGCDGGTIPKRDELVRTKKRPEQVDKDAETVARWKHCAISQEQLKSPIVSCELGRLYNKDSVIEHILDKSTNRLVEHIRNMKDIVTLQLTINPSYRPNVAERGDDYGDWLTAEFICPVTGLEMNGKHRFCYNRKCGCVLSERSIKEIKSDACHKCGSDFSHEDLVNINGSDQEIAALKEKMEQNRLQAKLDKQKAKKDSRKKKLDEPVASSSSERTAEESSAAKRKCGEGSATTTSTSKAKREIAASSSTAKDLNVRSVLVTEEKLRSSYSVAKDPGSSEAFKSLFTTHDSYKKQGRAHWVTYNPLYN